jgi:hypothetical protein
MGATVKSTIISRITRSRIQSGSVFAQSTLYDRDEPGCELNLSPMRTTSTKHFPKAFHAAFDSPRNACHCFVNLSATCHWHVIPAIPFRVTCQRHAGLRGRHAVDCHGTGALSGRRTPVAGNDSTSEGGAGAWDKRWMPRSA